ncbi:MAG: hypothetical protein WCI73_03735 [Phycisphaerae bacterium]
MAKLNITITMLEHLKMMADSDSGLSQLDHGVLNALAWRGLVEIVTVYLCPTCHYRRIPAGFRAPQKNRLIDCPGCKREFQPFEWSAGLITQSGRDLIATRYEELKASLPETRSQFK